MKFLHFHVECSTLLAENRKLGGDLRTGQIYFNHLHKVRPDLSRIVRGTGVDPFYRDEIVPVFLEFVATKW